MSILLVFALSTVTHANTIHVQQLHPAKLPIQAERTAELNTIPTALAGKDGYIGEKQDPLPYNKSSNQSTSLKLARSTVASLANSTTPTVIPILALLYSGASGSKSCRGTLLRSLNLPHPVSQHKQGACYDLPSNARCGLFISDKLDHCEADLFHTLGCLKTSQSYVNTVVFMPEVRPVRALWRSMLVRCGVEASDGVVLDPAVLEDLGIKTGS